MLTLDGLRVTAALNEALELRLSYLRTLREKMDSLPEDAKRERDALFGECAEFDAAFTSLLKNPSKKESHRG
jgi:hypothetical protein